MVKTRTTKKSIKNNQEEVLFEKNVNTAIAEIAKLYLSYESLSMGDISQLVLDQAKRLTKSPYGFVAYMDPATGYMMAETLTRDVWNECKIPNKSVVFKKFTGIWGWVLNNKKTVLTNKVIRDPRYKGIPKGHVRIEKFLAAPALLGNKLLGMVAVANSKSDYTDRERRYIEILADFYAIALQRKFTEDALKQSTAQLKANEEILRTMFETAKDCICIKDKNSVFIKVNKSCADLFNMTPEQMVGKTDYDIFSKKNADELVKQDQEVIKKGKTIFLDSDRETVRGIRAFNVIKTPLKDSKGSIIGVLGIARDVTEFRKLQAELLHAKAVESVSKLTSGIAHDFNNVLSAIDGYAALMLETIDKKSKMRFAIEEIKKTISRAVKITNSLEGLGISHKIKI